MAETKTKEAKPQVKLEDVRFNEENKVKAILACIPVVGLILLFVEKDDHFVRFYGAQYTILGAVVFAFSILVVIPVIGWVLACLSPLVSLAVLVLIIIGMVKANNGERFELPLVSDYAVKLMNAV